MGFVAHIPHYLAQLDFPEASVTLLEHVERAAGIAVDLTDLRAAARERDEEIATYLAANTEVLEVVQALEQQYDAFARAEDEGTGLLAENEPIPTGEEIGRQFEQFLAGLDGPETRAETEADAILRRGARRAPRHRDPRHRPLPRHQPRHATGSGSSAARSPRRR